MWPFKPKHVHDWECLRVRHFKMKSGFSASDLMRTVAHYKCRECGEIRTGEYEGYWTIEEVS